MKKKILLFWTLALQMLSISAQTKNITLEEIWNGDFREESLNEFRSLNNGKEYTVLNWDPSTRSTSVDLYSYNKQQKKKSIVKSLDLQIAPFSSYSFSSNENQLLLATSVESIYRRSTLGMYYVYNINAKQLIKVADQKIQEPTFSPQGDKIAFGYNNNIYIKNIETNITTQITFDGEKNKVINGITDWVYEEEFEFVRAFEWNKSGTQLAYIRFDETKVPEFSMDFYGNDLYPSQQVFKYPKAGESNSEVSIHNYSLLTQKTTTISFPSKPYYIPRIKFTENDDVLSVQSLNRHQNHLIIYLCEVVKNKVDLLLHEKNDTYISVTNNLTFLKDNSFLWTSEQNGFNHIYHYSKKGSLKNQITKGSWEVTDFYGYNSDDNTIFYQSTERGSINRDVYQISLKGKEKKRLSNHIGTNSAKFSNGYQYYINTFSSVQNPHQYSLHSTYNNKINRTILSNSSLSNKLLKYNTVKKNLSTISVNGNDLNMWMMKPANFDKHKCYPLLMYQYSGPGSQEVANNWNSINDYWYQILVSKGYIVVCVDGRGTGFKGSQFKKATYKELGKYEVEDQIQAAKQLSELSYVDENRIGIWGWSYGGFMSSNCILKGSDIFKMAIAVAPVTSWRFYDTIYTERYMQTPQENPTGYDLNSPLNFTNKLKGDFLLIHGSADDNVHVQNTMRLASELIHNNKQFDWLIYPDNNHGIYGGKTRLQLYKKMTDFIEENL